MVRSRERQIEIVANGLPLWHGAQLAIDATLVAPLSRNGAARPRADQVAGATIAHATRKKRHQTYPELLRASQCRLVVFALETGGRWGDEALDLLRRLARAKAREAPPWLRASAAQGWANHWSGMISVAAQRALAASLVGWHLHNTLDVDGETPCQIDVCADVRWAEAPPASRVC